MPMSLLKTFSAAIILMPVALFGQTPDLPTSSPEVPSTSARPTSSRPVRQTSGASQVELQSFLDAQSELDRRKMLDKQQRTFQLEIDGRYAKALKAYCDTGYGDERCLRPEASKPTPSIVALPVPVASGTVPPPPVAAKARVAQDSQDLPTVAQISGFGDELAAILIFPGGKRLRVVGPGPDGPRSQLPGGETVISIRPGEVLLTRPGESKAVPLMFQAAGVFGGSD